MPHSRDTIDIWSVEGRFQHLVYSPKGGIEGVLIDTDGVTTQFVFDRHDEAAAAAFAGLRPGQALVIEGAEQGPSPKGDAAHTVYRFERLDSVDGQAPEAASASQEIAGTVVRLNYARHGEANGVVLDTGDFVHTKPDGLARLGLKIGDKVRAEGRTQPLATGGGQVVEAVRVNGRRVAQAEAA
ncbi:hypothetical protein GNX71_30880 [Variovorax sp. RKNM96]|uniref:hypothetical protein n=1 Tax=Variovorax sp. RKNM96 TaxID=2681552 RepID=UPI00197D8572|nr:hypothetical protein [Variovorax sp. RKNM96]QSI33735.1 hypothetical protein GNX71_30880 [Variovorax sp. RKNM96]